MSVLLKLHINIITDNTECQCQKPRFFQNTAEFGIKNGQSKFGDVWYVLLNYIKLGYLCLSVQDMQKLS